MKNKTILWNRVGYCWNVSMNCHMLDINIIPYWILWGGGGLAWHPKKSHGTGCSARKCVNLLLNGHSTEIVDSKPLGSSNTRLSLGSLGPIPWSRSAQETTFFLAKVIFFVPNSKSCEIEMLSAKYTDINSSNFIHLYVYKDPTHMIVIVVLDSHHILPC